MYTDHIGQPLAVGDTIAYLDQRGVLNIAAVHALIPLVPHPSPSQWSPNALAREDQLRGSRCPTEFKGVIYEKPEKRYVVQVMKPKYSHYRDHNGVWQSEYRPTKCTLPTTQVLVLPAGSEAK